MRRPKTLVKHMVFDASGARKPRPRSFQDAHKAPPKRPQDAVQAAPKRTNTPSTQSKAPQDDPTRLQNAQRHSKKTRFPSLASQVSEKCSKTFVFTVFLSLRAAKKVSAPKMGPKRPPRRFLAPKSGPKRPPRGPQEAHKHASTHPFSLEAALGYGAQSHIPCSIL